MRTSRHSFLNRRSCEASGVEVEQRPLYSPRIGDRPSKSGNFAGGARVNLLLIATKPWIPIFSLANFCYALANMLPIEGPTDFESRLAGV